MAVEPPHPSGFARRLIGGTFNYGLGSILPQVVGFLLIPVYTAFLTPADYGILDLTAAFGAILVVLMRFGVPGAVTRFYFDHREGESLRDYISTINRFLWVSSFLIAFIATCLMFVAGRFVMPGIPLTFAAVVIVISLLSSNTDLQRRLIQAREQSRYSALLSLGFALGNIALAILSIAVFHWGVKGMLLAQLITGIVFFLQARYYLTPDLAGSYQPEYVRSSLHYGLGILPSHLLGNFAPYFVRSILAGQDSLDAVGQLGIATRFTNPMFILFSAFSTAFLPVYYATRKDGSPTSAFALTRVVRNCWLIALFLFLGTAFLAPPLIRIVTPTRFHDAAPLVRVLALGFLGQALYLLLTPEIFYQKKTWIISLISIVGVSINVAGAFFLVKAYDTRGAAWAAALGQIGSGALAGIFSFFLGSSSQQWLNLARVTAVSMIIGLAMILPSAPSPYWDVAIGSGLLLCFLALTWVVGDPSIRDISQMVRIRGSKSSPIL